jgi:hypothetical protein
MRYVVLLALIGLAGCASLEDKIASDTQKCEKLGFKRDTSDMSNCLLRYQMAREDYRRALIFSN